MSSKKWFHVFISLLLMCFVIIASIVIFIDPFFHYHKPQSELFYTLDNERSMNYGILEHFDYDSIITGSSMTENFQTSQADKLFDADFVKVSFQGCTYKEVNDNLKVAFASKHSIKNVIRCLDMDRFFDSKDDMYDEGEYPEYLYNNNPFDDVKYLFNRDVIYTRCAKILSDYFSGHDGGHTSFDDYAYWMDEVTYGKDKIMKDHSLFTAPSEVKSCELSLEEKACISENISQNVTEIASEQPDTNFYIFNTPYSAVWWGEKYQDGLLDKQLSAEKLIIEQLLQYDNIYVFSWNSDFKLTTNLDNYADKCHYTDTISKMIIADMSNMKHRITNDNLDDYIKNERNYYSNFDYNELF